MGKVYHGFAFKHTLYIEDIEVSMTLLKFLGDEKKGLNLPATPFFFF